MSRLVFIATLALLAGCNKPNPGLDNKEVVFQSTYSVVNKECDRYGRAIYVANRSGAAISIFVIDKAPECSDATGR